MSKSVPPVLRFLGKQTHIAEAAESGLKLGLLTEADWRGNLYDSIVAVVERKVKQATYTDGDCEYSEVLGLQGAFISDVREAFVGADPGELPDDCADAAKAVGGFALWAEEYNSVFVGERAMVIEKHCKGAGYAAIGAAARFLDATIMGGTPKWCVFESERIYSDWPEDEEGCHLPPPEMTAKLTHYDHIYSQKRDDIAVLKRALKGTIAPWQRTVMESAIKLFELLKMRPEYCEAADDLQYWHVLPIAVRWDEDDRADELIDSYHDMMAGIGNPNCLFLAAFGESRKNDDKASAESAVRAFLWMLEGLKHVCRILYTLDSQRNRLEDIFDSERLVNMDGEITFRPRIGAL